MFPWVVPGSPTTSCHSFTSRGSARPKELFPTVSHPVSRRLPAHPLCKPHAKNYTRERRGSHLAKLFSHSAFVAHRGDGPKVPLFGCVLNYKMSALSGFRFATRSSRAYGRVKILT